jgi:uncharacterized protein
MKPIFADTFYYVALLLRKDEAHQYAVAITRTIQVPIVTTAWVLTEVANALSSPVNRSLFLSVIDTFDKKPGVTLIGPSRELFDAGVALYRRRLDKEWSLTDCISFVVMKREGITDALTGDHHFEQAGFRMLLK